MPGLSVVASIMVAVVIAVVAIGAIVPMIVIPAIVAAVTPAIMMPLPIMRNKIALVPVVMHKVDPLAAGTVMAAMLAPMLAMARRHAQIDGLALDHDALDDSRLTVDHAWLRIWIIADVDAAIETGLTDRHGNPNVGGVSGGAQGGSSQGRCNQKTFHVESSML